LTKSSPYISSSTKLVYFREGVQILGKKVTLANRKKSKAKQTKPCTYMHNIYLYIMLEYIYEIAKIITR